MAPRRWPFLAAALVVGAALAASHGCQLVAGLYEPRASHCANGIQDGDEQGVDCGDPKEECPKCNLGSCRNDDECASFTCDGEKCVDPDCDDAKLECWICHRCSAKAACASYADCATGRCRDGECAACLDDKDCPSGACTSKVCVDVTCHNHVRDNSEGEVDCGGDCKTPCDGGTGDAGTDGGEDAGDAGDDGGTGGMDGGTSSSSSTSSSSTGSSSSTSSGMGGGMGTGGMGAGGTAMGTGGRAP